MINKDQFDDMHHAIGRIKLNKRWKAKTILDKAYRNKYVEHGLNLSWEELIKQGFAKSFKQKNFDGTYMIFYYVTEQGIDEMRRFLEQR